MAKPTPTPKTNTFEDDLTFAEGFVRYLAQRSNKSEVRMNAAALISAIELLDRAKPGWRLDAVEVLKATSATRGRIEDIFDLPTPDIEQSYAMVMRSLGSSTKKPK